MLTLQYDGGNVKFDRIELVDRGSVKIGDYADNYHSNQVAITYRFAIKQNAA